MKNLFKAIIEWLKNPPRTNDMGPGVKSGRCQCCDKAKGITGPR